MDLVVGRVIRAHGIKGETVVEIRTDDPGGRFTPGAVFRTEPAGAGPLTVRTVRRHQGRLLVAFAGVTGRVAAESLHGVRLLVEAADDEPADGEDYYDRQLVGLRAVTRAGDQVGEVVEVLHLPAQDVLVIRRPEQDADVLVPFVRDIVPDVDLAGGRVVLTPPPGLLDPNSETVEPGQVDASDANRHHQHLS
jgi:16S rRNA processing protein RimM